MSTFLPPGVWITLLSLDPATTEYDIQKVIVDRTGVEIPLESISIGDHISPVRGAIAIVAVDRVRVLELLQWALAEDTLHGRPLKIVRVDRKRAANEYGRAPGSL